LGHGDGQRTDGCASSLNQVSGSETSLRDGSAIVDGKSGKPHASERVESTPLKTKLIQDPMGYLTHQ